MEKKKKLLTVLINQHSYGYSGHVEPIQEVLYVELIIGVSNIPLLHLHDGRRCLHDHVRVAVADAHQVVREPGEKNCKFFIEIF